MNANAVQPLDRIRHALGVVAVFALIAALALGFAAPGAWRGAYRFAVMTGLAPALGSLWFLLIARTTGGRWSEALAPFLNAGGRLAPWLLALALPLAWLVPHAAARAFDYESGPMLMARAIVGSFVIVGVALAAVGTRARFRAWIGPVGLIALVFTLHVLADDWLMTADPEWHSTAFPLVWMTGQAVAGLACAILAALAAGVSPRARPALGLDLGNLLLAATLVWGYVAFAQFLIIWSGNVSREISWYVHRTNGAWAFVPPVLALIHLLLPIALLLSRRFKNSRLMLGAVAALLLAAQVLYAAWMTLPVAPDSASGVFAVALRVMAAAAVLGFFLHRYVALATRSIVSA